ncbi:MAG: carboxypeptidase-like regulatory domain-containing protein [Bacteroidota bacterium]
MTIYRIIFLLVLIFPLAGFAQNTQTTLEGHITNVDGQPISYANIGIVGTARGTVSDSNGYFVLYYDRQLHRSDTLRCSVIGYAARDFALQPLSGQLDITLQRSALELPEVVVRGDLDQNKIIGNTKARGDRNVNFALAKQPRQNLGASIGKLIKLKGVTSQLERFHFYVRQNNFASAKFRITLHRLRKRKPHQSMTDQSIIVTLSPKQTGWVEVDLRPYQLITDEDFVISIQWVDASEQGRRLNIPLQFPKFGHTHYYQFGSQDKWRRFANMSTAMYVELRQ